MPRRRLGVALLIPPPLDAEIDGLRRAAGDGSLGRIPAHLTLVPPVNVREDRLDEALAVLRRAAATTRPFAAELGPPATFMPNTPVLHLPVSAGEDEVRAVRDRVFRDPLERKLTWPFVAHVTLADEAEPARIEAAIVALAGYRIRVTFDRVHLLEEGPGRVWSPIADAPFASPAVVGRGGLPLELTTTQHLDAEAAAFASREWERYSRDAYGEGWRPDEPVAITARRDGVVVGVATGHIRGDDAYLGRLIADPSARGEGVGSHLLAVFESLAAERGCTRMTLRVRAGATAESWYRHRGWVTVATLPAWRQGHDFALMQRPL